MVKRLLNYTPQELIKLNAEELFYGIKMSEGRVITSYARVKGPNILQGVSNAEVCANFGSDIVLLNCFDPKNPIFPGLPSKNLKDDLPFAAIQMTIGKGWSAQEVKELIGRPISASFISTRESHAGLIPYSAKRIELCKQQGFDIIGIYGWGESEYLIENIREAKSIVGDTILIESGIPHGPGLSDSRMVPFNLRDIISKEFIMRMVEAGANIIQIPAAGSLTGFTKEFVSYLIDAIHEQGALASVGIHNSQEGTDSQTIRKIAIDNKQLGADIFCLGDAGLTESMPKPEIIRDLSIAIKGKRHTYSRMCMSVKR